MEERIREIFRKFPGVFWEGPKKVPGSYGDLAMVDSSPGNASFTPISFAATKTGQKGAERGRKGHNGAKRQNKAMRHNQKN